MKALILWVMMNGSLHVGSDILPVDICQRELSGLRTLYEQDRSNFGQRFNDPRTWFSHGYCVLVAGPPVDEYRPDQEAP